MKNGTTTIDKTSGLITSCKSDGDELMQSPLKPNFWRALTDNDLGAKLDTKLAIWKTAADADHRELTAFEVTQPEPGTVVIKTDSTIADGKAMLALDYTISGQRYDRRRVSLSSD